MRFKPRRNTDEHCRLSYETILLNKQTDPRITTPSQTVVKEASDSSTIQPNTWLGQSISITAVAQIKHFNTFATFAPSFPP